ncbi:MAG: hypothetical protein PHE51_09205 [Eubacteriales bacterium]|nr:hypothetical protein [Eubacteriales bacterium]
MSVEKIMKSDSIIDLLDAIDDFCRENAIRDNDNVCFELKDELEKSEVNELLTLLSTYLCVADDGDEIIESLYEFASNCRGFAQADEDITQKVTKDEFETVLDECEEKCNLKSCIEKEHKLNVVCVDACNEHREFLIKPKNDNINLIIPRIDINVDSKQYIAEELGTILYEVLVTKFKPDYITSELNRYIPETRNSGKATRQLFQKYFYDVVLHRERKPGIYTELDEHMKRVLNMEFFKRIILQYLRE